MRSLAKMRAKRGSRESRRDCSSATRFIMRLVRRQRLSWIWKQQGYLESQLRALPWRSRVLNLFWRVWMGISLLG